MISQKKSLSKQMIIVGKSTNSKPEHHAQSDSVNGRQSDCKPSHNSSCKDGVGSSSQACSKISANDSKTLVINAFLRTSQSSKVDKSADSQVGSSDSKPANRADSSVDAKSRDAGGAYAVSGSGVKRKGSPLIIQAYARKSPNYNVGSSFSESKLPSNEKVYNHLKTPPKTKIGPKIYENIYPNPSTPIDENGHDLSVTSKDVDVENKRKNYKADLSLSKVDSIAIARKESVSGTKTAPPYSPSKAQKVFSSLKTPPKPISPSPFSKFLSTNSGSKPEKSTSTPNADATTPTSAFKPSSAFKTSYGVETGSDSKPNNSSPASLQRIKSKGSVGSKISLIGSNGSKCKSIAGNTPGTAMRSSSLTSSRKPDKSRSNSRDSTTLNRFGSQSAMRSRAHLKDTNKRTMKGGVLNSNYLQNETSKMNSKLSVKQVPLRSSNAYLKSQSQDASQKSHEQLTVKIGSQGYLKSQSMNESKQSNESYSVKLGSHAYLKSQSQVSSKPGSKDVSKPASIDGSKLGNKDGSKPGSKDGSKPGSKDGSKPGSKDASKPGSKDGSKPGSKDASKPGSKDGSKPCSKDGSKPCSKDASKPGSKDASKPGIKDGSKPGSKDGSKFGSRDGSKPKIKDGSKPGSKDVSKPGSRDESKQVSKDGSKSKPGSHLSLNIRTQSKTVSQSGAQQSAESKTKH